MKIGITPDLIGWIQSWGWHVKVLKPKLLKRKILADLDAAIKLYNSKR